MIRVSVNCNTNLTLKLTTRFQSFRGFRSWDRTHFRWKIKWRQKDLGALGIMGEAAPFKSPNVLLRKDMDGVVRIERP